MADVPISLKGIKESEKQAPWSNRWIAEEDRYFLIKCSQYPLDKPDEKTGNPTTEFHRHRHHPSNGFLALQSGYPVALYKIPDPSNGDDDGFPESFPAVSDPLSVSIGE